MRYIFNLLSSFVLVFECAFAKPPGAEVKQEGYIHKWIAGPEIRGADVYSGQERLFKSVEGRLSVIVFTASWCEPCAKITPDLLRLEERYTSLGVDFLYVFSHDSAADAKMFADKAGLKTSVLSNQEILSFFHNPELPSLFFVDRRGWLFHKITKPDLKDFPQVAELLSLLSAF